jgi:hypothetical protein
MLALTDSALARLAIAATRARRSRRQQWLKDIAERIDAGGVAGSSPAAASI